MVNITQEQKKLFYDGGNVKDYVFDFPEIDLKITNDIIHEQSVTIKESICEENELKLGGCIASSIEFEVSEIMDYDLTGLQLKADLFVNLEEDGTSDLQLPMGVYRVDSCLQVNDKDYKKVVGYNAFYDASVDVSDWYNDFFADESKKTLVEMKESLLIHLGMSYIKQSLPNDSMKVEKTIEPNGKLTGIDVLRSICELNAGFGIIDRDGFFKVIGLSSDGTIYPEETLYPEESLYPEENSEWIGSSDGESKVAEYRDCTYEEYSVKPITCLNIKTNEDDYGVTIGTDLSNPYVITSNFLLYGKSTGELVNVGNPILYFLKEITYVPSNVKLDGLPFMECGDSFVLNKINDTVNSVVFTRKLSGVQSLIDTFESKGSEVRANEVGSNNEIVQLKGKILSIKKDVDGVKVEVSDFEKNTSTRFEQTESKIMTTVASSQKTWDIGEDEVDIYGFGAPTEEATVEKLGIFYFDQTNGKRYVCAGPTDGEYFWYAIPKVYKTIQNSIESSIEQTQNQIVLKVDSAENIVEVALGTDADDESKTVFQVGADNISLTADELLEIMSGGTLDLSAKNINISSDSFNVDSDGNVKMNDAELNSVTIRNGYLDIQTSMTEQSVIQLEYLNLPEAPPNDIKITRFGDSEPSYKDVTYAIGTYYMNLSSGWIYVLTLGQHGKAWTGYTQMTMLEYSIKKIVIDPSTGIEVSEIQYTRTSSSESFKASEKTTNYGVDIESEGDIKTNGIVVDGYRLVTGSVVIDYTGASSVASRQYISAPNIAQEKPAYVCNGDYDAQPNLSVSAIGIVPSTSQISFVISGWSMTHARYSYSYWIKEE